MLSFETPWNQTKCMKEISLKRIKEISIKNKRYMRRIRKTIGEPYNCHDITL